MSDTSQVAKGLQRLTNTHRPVPSLMSSHCVCLFGCGGESVLGVFGRPAQSTGRCAGYDDQQHLKLFYTMGDEYPTLFRKLLHIYFTVVTLNCGLQTRSR